MIGIRFVGLYVSSLPISVVFLETKWCEFCGLRKVLDVLGRNFFLPAPSPKIFDVEIAPGHGYAHANIHLRVSPNQIDIPVFVKIHYLPYSFTMPADMASALKARKYLWT